jgi:photosystem II stability/assembly factor-like uncharacterized protein
VAALALSAVLSAGALTPPVPAAQPGKPGPFAEHARLASRSLLLDIAIAGQRLVAVGERGHVLLSDDRGRTWTQAQSVPTQALLTGVCFSNALQGVAVGHDEVILITRDGGQTWSRAHFAPESQQPLLDVTCADDGQLIAVGAYGVYFTSPDRGTTWRQRKFEAVAAQVARPATDDLGRDVHLNRIAAASSTRLYIAAEGGHLYRSDDAGQSWHELPSPYDGSFFGVKPLGADIVLAYGLRGNLFRSEDAGASWRKVETGTHAMLNDVVSVGTGGTTAAVGLSGVVLVSHDAGKSFALMQQDDRKGLAAALAVGVDMLVVVGEGGARLIRIAPAAATPP